METLMIPGTYRDGQVELDEVPAGWPSPGRVKVVFQPDVAVGPQPAEPTPEERAAALRRLMALFERGIPLGGPPYPTREELHERARGYSSDGETGKYAHGSCRPPRTSDPIE